MDTYQPDNDPIRRTWEHYQRRRSRRPLEELTPEKLDQAMRDEVETSDVA